VGPCHHGISHIQIVVGGDDMQIWRAATSSLSAESQSADKGWVEC